MLLSINVKSPSNTLLVNKIGGDCLSVSQLLNIGGCARSKIQLVVHRQHCMGYGICKSLNVSGKKEVAGTLGGSLASSVVVAERTCMYFTDRSPQRNGRQWEFNINCRTTL